jgi:hypothetical protein
MKHNDTTTARRLICRGLAHISKRLTPCFPCMASAWRRVIPVKSLRGPMPEKTPRHRAAQNSTRHTTEPCKAVVVNSTSQSNSGGTLPAENFLQFSQKDHVMDSTALLSRIEGNFGLQIGEAKERYPAMLLRLADGGALDESEGKMLVECGRALGWSPTDITKHVETVTRNPHYTELKALAATIDAKRIALNSARAEFDALQIKNQNRHTFADQTAKLAIAGPQVVEAERGLRDAVAAGRIVDSVNAILGANYEL